MCFELLNFKGKIFLSELRQSFISSNAAIQVIVFERLWLTLQGLY